MTKIVERENNQFVRLSNFTNMSRSLVFITIALIATGANAQCSAVAASAVAPNVGGVVEGSTGYVGYVFKGTTAPSNGIFCNGCAMYFSGDTAQTAGNWYTESAVTVGQTSGTETGFYCRTDGTACQLCNTAAPCTADVAGNFYKMTSVSAGQTATTTGVLCPATNQAANCATNTCAPAAAGETATCLGTACTADGGCMPVINGYAVPTGTNGIYCSGCVFKSSGNTASSAGNWWTCDSVAAAYVPTADGIFCPTGNGACATKATPYTSVGTTAGKYCTSEAIVAGAVAPEDGVLCPNVGVSVIGVGGETVAGEPLGAKYADGSVNPTVTAGESPKVGTAGTSQGASMVASNSASKALFPIATLVSAFVAKMLIGF